MKGTQSQPCYGESHHSRDGHVLQAAHQLKPAMPCLAMHTCLHEAFGQLVQLGLMGCQDRACTLICSLHGGWSGRKQRMKSFAGLQNLEAGRCGKCIRSFVRLRCYVQMHMCRCAQTLGGTVRSTGYARAMHKHDGFLFVADPSCT
eukprot:361359-Chlamydomonas_euryale.AAC.2